MSGHVRGNGVGNSILETINRFNGVRQQTKFRRKMFDLFASFRSGDQNTSSTKQEPSPIRQCLESIQLVAPKKFVELKKQLSQVIGKFQRGQLEFRNRIHQMVGTTRK